MKKGQLKKYVGGTWITVELEKIKKRDRFKIMDFKNSLIQTYVAENDAVSKDCYTAVDIGNGLSLSIFKEKKEKKKNADKGK